MFDRLSARDKKALIILAVFTVAMIVFLGGGKLSETRRQTRQSYEMAVDELAGLVHAGSSGGTLAVAPGFVFPENGGEEQILAFRDALNGQFRQVGMNSNPLQVMSASGNERINGNQLVRIQATATGDFSQVLNLMAQLYENPHLVGLDRFRINMAQGRGSQAELEMTVLTLTR